MLNPSRSKRFLGIRVKNILQQIPRIETLGVTTMSSCKKPDDFHTFNVSAWQPKATKATQYSHSELGYFSIDEERHFLPNKSKLGTLKRSQQEYQNLDIDLNTEFEQWKNLPNVQQHLDSILHWILLNKKLLTKVDSDTGLGAR